MTKAFAALLLIVPCLALSAPPSPEPRAQGKVRTTSKSQKVSKPLKALLVPVALKASKAPPKFLAKNHVQVKERVQPLQNLQPARLTVPSKSSAPSDGAEARLIEIYKLIVQAKMSEALPKAKTLVDEHPNFQLAQLVYGDLLTATSRPLLNFGDVPDSVAHLAGPMLKDLRHESQLRLQALRERPAPGTVPSQFLALSRRTKHAIAIDASRSRLYLFENTVVGLTLLADYYISVGKAGTEKNIEGDLRTPLGVYFISGNLNPNSLKELYGSGALPLNYPNQLDLKRGKTGSGIWLHGTPPAQFSRPPLATDGCVVLANPDLERVIKTVEVRTTPVVISQSLKWVAPKEAKANSKLFAEAFEAWQQAKSSPDISRVIAWYTPDFTSYGKTLAEWKPTLEMERKQVAKQGVRRKYISYLHWTDSDETMVVTFDEIANNVKTGRTKRQYWTHQANQWKIFFEGII